jgi:putative endonuclease
LGAGDCIVLEKVSGGKQVRAVWQDDNSRLSWYHLPTMGQPHYVYIMTDEQNSVLYTGRTGDLKRRAGEHRAGRGSGFTRRTNAHKLVYYETVEDAQAAIAREKRIKASSRQAKLDLIERLNPGWQDLYDLL